MMMKLFNSALLLSVLTFLAEAAPRPASSPAKSPVVAPAVQSDQWSGLTLNAPAGTNFSTVSAEWNVMAVSPPVIPADYDEFEYAYNIYYAIAKKANFYVTKQTQMVGIQTQVVQPGMMTAGTLSVCNMEDGQVGPSDYYIVYAVSSFGYVYRDYEMAVTEGDRVRVTITRLSDVYCSILWENLTSDESYFETGINFYDAYNFGGSVTWAVGNRNLQNYVADFSPTNIENCSATTVDGLSVDLNGAPGWKPSVVYNMYNDYATPPALVAVATQLSSNNLQSEFVLPFG